MTKRLAKVVNKLSKTEYRVTRRNAIGWDNARPVDNGAVVAMVKLAIQRVTSKPIALQRLDDGDQTEGQTRLWVTLENLDQAYEVGVPNVPLNWTELRTAPPERADGPPGDLVDDNLGRRFEVIERLGWNASESFTEPGTGQFQRYVIEERGATPP